MIFSKGHVVSAGLCLASLLSSSAFAQGRLIRRNQASVGPRMEQITFADPVADGDGEKISKLRQLSVPFGTSIALGGGAWNLDVAAAYTSGTVDYENGSSATLSGISDVRLRASGHLLSEHVLLTVSANLPTGATSLDVSQLSAVRALAAPAWGMSLPAVGFGPAGSVGLVGTREIGSWVGALGASYEYRGKFSPIAALQAGAEPDFDPGNAMHFSVGLERFLGENRLSLQGGTDFFTQDELSSGGAPQTLKLGPVITLESSLTFGGEGVRDGRLFGALRRRSAFSRNGATVDGSAGVYLNAGLEGGIPMGRVFDFHLAADVLSHSGLDVDNTLMTAGATSAGVLLGLRARSTGGMFEPFVRVAKGSIDTGSSTTSITGLSFGATFVLRF